MDELSAEALAERLHDATLAAIRIEWGTRRAELEFLVAIAGTTRRTTLEAVGITALHCTREDPWGQSASVNRGTVVRPNAEQMRLELEMQSGDELSLSAATMTVRVADFPS